MRDFHKLLSCIYFNVEHILLTQTLCIVMFSSMDHKKQPNRFHYRAVRPKSGFAKVVMALRDDQSLVDDHKKLAKMCGISPVTAKGYVYQLIRAKMVQPMKKERERLEWIEFLSKGNRKPSHQRMISDKIQHSVIRSIKTGKGGWWESFLGYTFSDLKSHLSTLFQDGMRWDNYGSYWCLDHIRPVASFRFQSISDPDVLECWSLSNLQPLTRRDNSVKSSIYKGIRHTYDE